MNDMILVIVICMPARAFQKFHRGSSPSVNIEPSIAVLSLVMTVNMLQRERERKNWSTWCCSYEVSVDIQNMLTDVDGTLPRRRLRGFFWTQTKRSKKWALYQMVMDSVAHHSWGKSLYPFLYMAWIIYDHLPEAHAVCRLRWELCCSV